VWKGTVLIPVGSTVDLLIDSSNPWVWVLHWRIAEHLGSGIMMTMQVDSDQPLLCSDGIWANAPCRGLRWFRCPWSREGLVDGWLAPTADCGVGSRLAVSGRGG